MALSGRRSSSPGPERRSQSKASRRRPLQPEPEHKIQAAFASVWMEAGRLSFLGGTWRHPKGERAAARPPNSDSARGRQAPSCGSRGSAAAGANVQPIFMLVPNFPLRARRAHRLVLQSLVHLREFGRSPPAAQWILRSADRKSGPRVIAQRSRAGHEVMGRLPLPRSPPAHHLSRRSPVAETCGL